MSATLDFDSLLTPLAGDNPCGQPVSGEVKEKLEFERTEDDPNLPATRPEGHKKANWNAVVELASETLERDSKDLLVAARLTEGLTQRHRFSGLRDGLRLMREMCERWWDHVYPQITDGNIKRRAGPFNWLDTVGGKVNFPTAIRQLPLLPAGDDRVLTWLECDLATQGKGEIAREDFNKARMLAPREPLEQLADEISESLQEMEKLKQLLIGRMGQESAPGFTELRKSVEDCRHLLSQIIGQRPESASNPDTSSNGDAGSDRPRSSAQAITTRAEAYRELERVAARLRELDPHSPIPYMVTRCVGLASLPLPKMLSELIRSSEALTELHRELGVKPESGEASSSSSSSEG